jgi:N-acetylglucosamine kinase-like BadF-type ATPase
MEGETRLSKQDEPKLLIGIEGGGTRTTCLIAKSDGSIIGKGRGGPSNILVVGKEMTKRSILEAVSGATEGKGLGARASALCIGAAGSGNPEGKRRMQDVLSELKLSDRHVIVHDGVIALMGATAGKPGIVLIAGTGSVCFGVNSKGEFGRSSGWGYILGDEGSGYDIAKRAMAASLRAHDMRGENTVLVEKLKVALNMQSVEDLVGKVYAQAMPRDQMSKLASLVLEAAKEGDKVAAGILEYAGSELGTAAVAVAKQLNMLGSEFEVATAGGILDNFGEFIMGPLRATVLAYAPKARFTRAKFDPVVGAVIMAARESGVEVSEEFLKKLHWELSK